MQVTRWNSERDGSLSEDAMRRKLEERGYRVDRYLYPPGTYFPDHSHRVDKIDAILTGRLRITMGHQEVILEPGDMVVVPHNAVHAAEVVGDETVLSLDGVRIR